MLELVIFFLLVSVYLYCLLGGADFGAGIIELFTNKKHMESTKKLVNEAIAPIWEANHMWLIIAVVILFNAFPYVYTQIMTTLYIPMILLLVGIVLRGTAFTFRHYDAIIDKSQKTYTTIFSVSSLIVSFFLGTIIGGMTSGTIVKNSSSFFELYLYPWLNPFSLSVGVFVPAIFAFIASVYLIGDTTDQSTRKLFIRKSKTYNIVMVISGGMVFITSWLMELSFTKLFFGNVFSILMLVFATLSLPVLWKSINDIKIWRARFLAGGQLLFILGAFYLVYFPVIVNFKDGESMTLFNSAAPEVTLKFLGWALIAGSFLIFPSLIYLLKVFKIRENEIK